MKTIRFYYRPIEKEFRFSDGSVNLITSRPRNLTKTMILEILKYEPYISITDISKIIRYTWETTNVHIKDLLDMGLVASTSVKLKDSPYLNMISSIKVENGVNE